MFDTAALKRRAKEVLKTAFIPILATVIIQFIFSNVITLLTSCFINILMSIPNVSPYAPQLVLFVLSTLVAIFIYAPLIVGTTKLILDSSRLKPADYTKILEPFKKEYYFKTVKAMSLRMFISQILSQQMAIVTRLYFFVYTNGRLPELPQSLPQQTVILVSVAFAALSIFLTVKCFDYFLLEYIVADNPKIGLREALKRSKTYMKGNKFATLILAFSLIGWYILGFIAFMVGIIFVQVYMQAIIAQLYFELSGENNIIHTTCEDV